jgi:hypothetical protein
MGLRPRIENLYRSCRSQSMLRYWHALRQGHETLTPNPHVIGQVPKPIPQRFLACHTGQRHLAAEANGVDRSGKDRKAKGEDRSGKDLTDRPVIVIIVFPATIRPMPFDVIRVSIIRFAGPSPACRRSSHKKKARALLRSGDYRKVQVGEELEGPKTENVRIRFQGWGARPGHRAARHRPE